MSNLVEGRKQVIDALLEAFDRKAPADLQVQENDALCIVTRGGTFIGSPHLHGQKPSVESRIIGDVFSIVRDQARNGITGPSADYFILDRVAAHVGGHMIHLSNICIFYEEIVAFSVARNVT